MQTLPVPAADALRWWPPRAAWRTMQLRLVHTWLRINGLTSEPPAVVEHHHGADYSANMRQAADYSPRASLSTMAAFPWVYAAMLRRAGDIAGLPLQVGVGRGRKFRPLDDHPLYDLLDTPSTKSSGRQWRKQMAVDHRLCGNHITAILGIDGPIGMMSLQRLHPERVRIEPDPRTGWGNYLFEGGGEPICYPDRQILHLRAPSWADDPRGLWGTGAIQSLSDDLTADLRARKHSASLAKNGRPSMVVSPKGDADEVIWDEDVRRDIREQLKEVLMPDADGIIVLSNYADLKMPNFSPRDLEFPALRQQVREAVLAITGVPPHMVGLPTANYAMAEAQERAYWGMLQAEAADIEDAIFAPLCKLFSRGGQRLRVRHDFSSVDVLQEGKTSRLGRAVTLVKEMGLKPLAALSAEGIDYVDETMLAEKGGNVSTPTDEGEGGNVSTPADGEDEPPASEEEPPQRGQAPTWADYWREGAEGDDDETTTA